MRSKRVHYNCEEKRRLLHDNTSLNDENCKTISAILDCLPFSMLREVSKQIAIISRGQKEE